MRTIKNCISSLSLCHLNYLSRNYICLYCIPLYFSTVPLHCISLLYLYYLSTVSLTVFPSLSSLLYLSPYSSLCPLSFIFPHIPHFVLARYKRIQYNLQHFGSHQSVDSTFTCGWIDVRPSIHMQLVELKG